MYVTVTTLFAPELIVPRLQVKLGPLGTLPIRSIDLAHPVEKLRHDRIVDLVESMLTVQRERRLSETTVERGTALSAEALLLDAQIDDEVFQLYDLNAADITRVEEAVASLATPP